MITMLLDFYRAIEDSSARMLQAAQLEDWDGVVRCEGACAVLIEQLRLHAKTEVLGTAEKLEKTKIMCRILQNDAQIRFLTEPHLDQINPAVVGAAPSYLH
jgi:flagellar protein FliT